MGGDVDDLVRDLVRRAGGDVKRAEHGIIYLDEVDKLAAREPERDGTSRPGRADPDLLKLMEDAEVPLVSPNDVTGQLQSAMAAMRGGSPAAETINTRHILFIASGAFSGLDRLIRLRLATVPGPVPPLNAAPDAAASRNSPPSTACCRTTTGDFIQYGLEPEFVGRLPVRVACHALDTDDLFNVLRRSESSLIHQYERAFGAYGIRVEFRDDGLRRLAERAALEQTGARGLMTVCERVFRGFKFRLPATRVRGFAVTARLVDDPPAELRRLLSRRPRLMADLALLVRSPASLTVRRGSISRDSVRPGGALAPPRPHAPRPGPDQVHPPPQRHARNPRPTRSPRRRPRGPGRRAGPLRTSVGSVRTPARRHPAPATRRPRRRPLRYVPDDAFIARFRNVPPAALRALTFVRWFGEYRPDYRVAARLRELAAGGFVADVSLALSPLATPEERFALRRSLQRLARETRPSATSSAAASRLPQLATLSRSPTSSGSNRPPSRASSTRSPPSSSAAAPTSPASRATTSPSAAATTRRTTVSAASRDPVVSACRPPRAARASGRPGRPGRRSVGAAFRRTPDRHPGPRLRRPRRRGRRGR